MKQIDPKLLINDKYEDEFQNFFLILSLIYNDLKGLHQYLDWLKLYRKDKKLDALPKNEPTYELGEYAGMRFHLFRLMTATVYEYLVFLKKYKKMTESGGFGNLRKRLNNNHDTQLSEILEIAFDRKTKNKTEFQKYLVMVRNNGSFHYYQIGNAIREGFNSYFIKEEKNASNEYALYAQGENMEKSRYFFADASLIQTHESWIGLNQHNNIDKLIENLEKINNTTSALMYIYFNQIRESTNVSRETL